MTLLVTSAAFAQFPSSETPNPSVMQQMQTPVSSPSSDTTIGPRDILDVRVLQDASLNARAVVGDDGKVNLPLLNKVDVAGLTTAQAEARIRTLLDKYLAKADVTVTIAEAGNKPISLIGSVTHPGRIGATGNITLLQALTQAGGLASGYGRTLYVLRTAQNGLSEQLAIDVDDLLINGNPDLNIPLLPNDIVNVPHDTPINIYVLGEVMRPGKVEFTRTQRPTLLQVISVVGGLTDRATKTLLVKRLVGKDQKTFKYNYRQLLNGKIPDPLLQDNDIINVDESVF